MEQDLESVVSILEDDAFRAGGSITNDRLLILAAKYQLSPEAIVEVKQRLVQRSVVVELDEDLEREPSPQQGPDEGPDAEALGKVRGIIDTYFRESARYKLLTREEELALARRIHAGQAAAAQVETADLATQAALQSLIDDGQDAREDLIQANLRLVPFVAKQVDTFGNLSQEDLIQEGNLGLLRAADKFDGDHGSRFSTYAYWWIWSFMMRASNDRSRLVRVPVHICDRIPTLLRAQRALERERDGAPVSPQELADVLGWRLKTVQLVLHAHSAASVSIDVGARDDAPTLAERLTSPPEASPDVSTTRREQRHLVKSLVEGLGKRLAYVVTERFGLANDVPRTLEEIGVQLGVTRERIRQLEKKALEKLRHPSRLNLMRDIFGIDRKVGTPEPGDKEKEQDDDAK